MRGDEGQRAYEVQRLVDAAVMIEAVIIPALFGQCLTKRHSVVPPGWKLGSLPGAIDTHRCCAPVTIGWADWL